MKKMLKKMKELSFLMLIVLLVLFEVSLLKYIDDKKGIAKTEDITLSTAIDNGRKSKENESISNQEKIQKESTKSVTIVDEDNEKYKLKEVDVTNKNLNFDDRLLMYEGDCTSDDLNKTLDILISDSEDDFYYKPIIKTQNYKGIGNDQFEYTNYDNYKNKLQEIKSNIQDGANYNVSFEYGALNASAKTVVITQK